MVRKDPKISKILLHLELLGFNGNLSWESLDRRGIINGINIDYITEVSEYYTHKELLGTDLSLEGYIANKFYSKLNDINKEANRSIRLPRG